MCIIGPMILTQALITVLLCSLVACGGSSEPVAKSAPVLSTVEDKDVAANNPFRLELEGFDINGDTLTFSANAASNSRDPFALATPPVFDTNTGILEWTPTIAEIGNYSIEFTATENTPEALSSSIVVYVKVATLGRIGEMSYETNCAQCHGIDGLGLSGPDIRFKTYIDIVNAMNNLSIMQNVAKQIDESKIDAIAHYILTQFANVDIHDQFDLSNGCVQCHNGIDAYNRPPSHIPTSDVCEACHNTDKYVPVIFVDHNQVSENCSDCHISLFAF